MSGRADPATTAESTEAGPDTPKTPRVGFIGLGSQGGPMARRIIDAGYPTTLWARRDSSLKPYAGTSATVAGTPAELAAASHVVCLCVVGDADVNQVATGENGVLAGMSEGSVLVVHSTVHPDTCHALAAQAESRGVTVVDAPVSGGGPAAEKGTLLVMVGGETSAVERIRPVFATYGDPVVHLGGLGTGQVTKLVNNLLFTANLANAASTFALARDLGIEPDRLGEVISHGSANSFAFASVSRSGGTLDRLAAHAGPLLRKDVGLLADIAAAAGVSVGAVLDAADAALRAMRQER